MKTIFDNAIQYSTIDMKMQLNVFYTNLKNLIVKIKNL